MTGPSMVKRLHNWLKDSRGIAAIEFALAAPLLVTLLLGSADILRLMLLHQKVEKVAYTMADLVTQGEQITAGDMAEYYMAPAELMDPFTFAENGRVIITSVYRGDEDAVGKVRWRSEGGGTLVRTSEIGEINADATLPGGLVLNTRDNVIVAEVFYQFTQMFPVDFLNTDEIYKVAVFKPRLGSLLTAP